MAPTSSCILIVGGGPAGATAAYWLAKAGYEVLVVERASEKFAYGQGIDITGPAVDLVKKMGLYETIQAQTTGEAGFAIVDDEANTVAQFDAGSGASLTQDIEIMRGDLTMILAEAANASDKVTFRYGSTITSIQQEATHVSVVLKDQSGEHSEDFAAVIGADGLNSKVRRLVFTDHASANSYIGTEQYCGYFSMDATPDDLPNSRLQHAPRRRTILIRPTSIDSTLR